MPSFDIVSRVDLQEVDNAINQAAREIGQRYDFKGSKSEIRWDKKDEVIILGDDDYKLNAVIDILKGKLVKRGVSLKALKYGTVQEASGGMKRCAIKIRQGISKEEAREVIKLIKGIGVRVQSQIMEEQVRVTGKKRDDLQAVIQGLKAKDLDINLQFVNFRE